MDKINPILKKNFSLAEKYFSEGKFDSSIKEYKNILKNNPNFVQAIFNLAIAYEQSGEFDDAIKNYLKCLTISPKEKMFINNLANVYFKKGELEKSLQQLKNSFLVDNSQLRVIEGITECLIKLNLRKKAEIFLNEIIKKFPENKILNIMHGENLIALNKHKLGLDFVRKGTGFIEFKDNKVNII